LPDRTRPVRARRYLRGLQPRPRGEARRQVLHGSGCRTLG
jgi:hypothetical protein